MGDFSGSVSSVSLIRAALQPSTDTFTPHYSPHTFTPHYTTLLHGTLQSAHPPRSVSHPRGATRVIQRQAGAPSRRNTGKCTVDYRQGCCTIKSVELGAATWVTPYNNNNQGMHQGAPALGDMLASSDLKSTR